MNKNKKTYMLLLSLAMGLSSQVMAQSAGQYAERSGGDCSSQDPTKRSSKDSSCISPGLIATQVAQPKINSADAITPFGTAGASCVTPWGQTIPDYSGVMAFLGSTGTYNYSTGVWAGECQEEFRYCAGGQLSGSYQYQSCDIGAVNGTCGYASGAYYTYPTTGPATNSLCNPQYTYGGLPPAGETPPSTAANSNVFLSGNTYSWTCAGENGGSSASCAAYRRINAQCGSNNGTASRTTPPASCDLGNSTGISGSGPWSWSCTGVNGGADSSCYVSKIIDGVCGSSNGTSLASAPSSGLCGAGNASGVSGSGPWSWSCTGTNGGNNASCSATYTPPPAPGITVTLSGYRLYGSGVIFDSLTTLGGHFEVPNADIRYINLNNSNLFANGAIIRTGRMIGSNVSLNGGAVLSGVLIDPTVTIYGRNMTIHGVSYGSCMVYYRQGGTNIETIC